MGIFTTLSKEKARGALHISDQYVSLAVLPFGSTDLSSTEYAYTPLAPGTIVNGRVVEPKSLTNAIHDLREKIHRVKYVAVALPSSSVFVRAITFPKTISESLKREAIETAREWRIPFEKDDAYTDTEYSHTDDGDIAFLGGISKKDAEPYYEAIRDAGLFPIAVESELTSLARTLSEETPLSLISIPQEDAIDFAIFQKNKLLFSRKVPSKNLPTKTAITAELSRLTEYAEVAFGKKTAKRTIDTLPLNAEVQAAIGDTEENKIDFLPLFGALMRSRIPQGHDTYISLLPIGTEAAYEYQKFNTYTRLIGSVSLVTSLLFALAFASVWYFFINIRSTLPDKTVIDTGTIGNISDKQKQMDTFATLVRTAGDIAANEHVYSDTISLIRTNANSGISLTLVASLNGGPTIRITGTASSREHLNAFLTALKSSPAVLEVDSPITGADLRTDIPFSIQLTMKDESIIRSK